VLGSGDSDGTADFVEAFAAATVGSGGGTVTSADGLVSITVPPGALADDTSLSITRRAAGSFELGAGAREVTVSDLQPTGAGSSSSR
jgi:hypothetical protein